MNRIDNSNNQPHKPNIQSSQNMTPEQASDYIWNDLLGELQSAYNDQIINIQKEHANDPAKMQDLIKKLGEKYQEQVTKISDAYNAVRTPGVSQADINKAIENAKAAIAEMGGAKPTPETPEQTQASEIDQKANDIIQETKNQIDELSQKLNEVKGNIAAYEKQITNLEGKIAELSKTDPKKAAEAQNKLDQAKADLKSLKEKATEFESSIKTLQDFQTQITSKQSEINSLYQSIMNGVDPGGNLTKLQKALKDLEAIQSSVQAFASSKTEAANAAIQAASELGALIKSIQVSGGVSPKPGPEGWNPHGQEAYIDITLLPYWSMKDYSMWEEYPNGIIPAADFEKYLNSMFEQMKAAGINQIDLAFAQFASIDEILACLKGEDVSGSSDLIVGIMRDHQVLNEDGTVTDAFSKFIEMAHKNGMKIDLSIGGENTAAAQICKEGETPAGQAAKLAELMEILGIDKVDFDLENAAIVQQNTTEELRAFFSEVHKLLSAQGKESIITTMGSIADWVGNDANPGQGFFHDLFYDEQGNSIFNEMFDGLNLMLYGQTTSYLDIGGDRGWGIDDWLDVIGKENASKIHIGFEDAVNYADTSSNQGDHPFDIRPGSTSGEAAAQIYYQIEQWLEENGYSSDLGAPFWWPQYDGDHQTRYQPLADGTVDFMYGDEIDFWKELNRLEGDTKIFQNRLGGGPA